MIYNDFLRNGLAVFQETLGDAIADRFKLHSSIAKDIGYMWNEELNETSGLVYKDSGFWVGCDHLVWTNRGYEYLKTATWLYNNEKGEIILEITPFISYFQFAYSKLAYFSLKTIHWGCLLVRLLQ